MKSFLKENGYSIVKLFLNQIALAVFAIMLSPIALSSRTAMLLLSIFSALFFLYLNYMAIWEIGTKDKLRIDAGRMPAKPFKGLILSLCANIPNLISATLIGIGAIINTKFGQSMSIICDLVSRILNNMYFGMMNTLEYALYRDAYVSKAVDCLLGASETSAEIVAATTLISDPNYTIKSLTDAISILSDQSISSEAVTEALALLDNATTSPQIIENWWWFLVIIIPSLLVGFLAYTFGVKNFRILSIFGIKPIQHAKNKK